MKGRAANSLGTFSAHHIIVFSDYASAIFCGCLVKFAWRHGTILLSPAQFRNRPKFKTCFFTGIFERQGLVLLLVAAQAHKVWMSKFPNTWTELDRLWPCPVLVDNGAYWTLEVQRNVVLSAAYMVANRPCWWCASAPYLFLLALWDLSELFPCHVLDWKLLCFFEAGRRAASVASAAWILSEEDWRCYPCRLAFATLPAALQPTFSSWGATRMLTKLQWLLAGNFPVHSFWLYLLGCLHVFERMGDQWRTVCVMQRFFSWQQTSSCPFHKEANMVHTLSFSESNETKVLYSVQNGGVQTRVECWCGGYSAWGRWVRCMGTVHGCGGYGAWMRWVRCMGAVGTVHGCGVYGAWVRWVVHGCGNCMSMRHAHHTASTAAPCLKTHVPHVPYRMYRTYRTPKKGVLYGTFNIHVFGTPFFGTVRLVHMVRYIYMCLVRLFLVRCICAARYCTCGMYAVHENALGKAVWVPHQQAHAHKRTCTQQSHQRTVPALNNRT